MSIGPLSSCNRKYSGLIATPSLCWDQMRAGNLTIASPRLGRISAWPVLIHVFTSSDRPGLFAAPPRFRHGGSTGAPRELVEDVDLVVRVLRAISADSVLL